MLGLRAIGDGAGRVDVQIWPLRSDCWPSLPARFDPDHLAVGRQGAGREALPDSFEAACSAPRADEKSVQLAPSSISSLATVPWPAMTSA